MWFQLSDATGGFDELESQGIWDQNHNQTPFNTSRVKPPNWHDIIIPQSIDHKANFVELPVSLRMIKKKKQWKQGFVEVGESACTSVMKAFLSMVFIIRELRSYTLQMRQVLFHQKIYANDMPDKRMDGSEALHLPVDYPNKKKTDKDQGEMDESILWSNSGWCQIPPTSLYESSNVKKAYQRARLRLHPDKLQQGAATLSQKYIAERIFLILQEAWDAYISQDIIISSRG